MNNQQIEAKLLEIEDRLRVLEQRAEPAVTSTPPVATKPLSIREFLNTKLPKTANDKTITVGYYLEHILGYEYFGADDIKDAFRSAKLPAPKNVNDVVNKNITKGLIMDSGSKKDNKKTWVLTATGEAAVEQGFTSSE